MRACQHLDTKHAAATAEVQPGSANWSVAILKFKACYQLQQVVGDVATLQLQVHEAAGALNSSDNHIYTPCNT